MPQINICPLTSSVCRITKVHPILSSDPELSLFLDCTKIQSQYTFKRIHRASGNSGPLGKIEQKSLSAVGHGSFPFSLKLVRRYSYCIIYRCIIWRWIDYYYWRIDNNNVIVTFLRWHTYTCTISPIVSHAVASQLPF